MLDNETIEGLEDILLLTEGFLDRMDAKPMTPEEEKDYFHLVTLRDNLNNALETIDRIYKNHEQEEDEDA